MSKTKKNAQDILSDLIAFNTISDRSNLDLMHYIQNYLDGYGITSNLIKSTDEEKANLHAIIGPKDKGGIALSGHTDVVPVAGQNWHSDPFQLIEKNDKLYGRGTSDMKGFVAAVLSKIPEMINANLKAPFHLAFSYDEEVGCLGVTSLVDFITTQVDIVPDICIVGEPTSMQPIIAHKGGHHVHCEIAGHECHSSLAPYGVNALEYGADLVHHIRKVAKRIANEGPFNTDFDPPYTTLNVGLFNAGTALNIIPNRAEFEFEMRMIPDHNSDEIVDEIREYAFKILEPHMKEIDPKSGFTFTETVKIPAFSIDEDSAAVKTVINLTGSNDTRKVSFATEAGYFQRGGIPTVVCGPGNIEQAHKPDEFISKEQMKKCDRFLNGLIRHNVN